MYMYVCVCIYIYIYILYVIQKIKYQMSKSLPCARACARNLRKAKLLAQGICARTRARNLRKELAQKPTLRKELAQGNLRKD